MPDATDLRTVKALIVEETSLTAGIRLAFRRQREVRIPSLGITIGYFSDFSTVSVSRYTEKQEANPPVDKGAEQPHMVSHHPPPNTKVIREIDFPASIAEQALAALQGREALQEHAALLRQLTAIPKQTA